MGSGLPANPIRIIQSARHLQHRDDEAIDHALEALEIANRCSHILQQADIHLFLGAFFCDLAAGEVQAEIDYDRLRQRYLETELPAESTDEELLRLARKHAERAKKRTYQMIDVESGERRTKPEEWKYKPCYDRAGELLGEYKISTSPIQPLWHPLHFSNAPFAQP